VLKIAMHVGGTLCAASATRGCELIHTGIALPALM